MADFFSIGRKVSKCRKVQKSLADRAEKKVNVQKERTLEEFDNHPVTEELKAGEHSDNISGTLSGYGNLFSFIGFFAGEDPTKIVREILAKNIRFYRTPIRVDNYKNGNSKFTFKIKYPELADFEEDTPFPEDWRNGSWLVGIEQGIYGFQSYLYNPEFETYEQSRSTSGLQAKAGNIIITVRDGKFKNTKYMSEIIRNFITRVKSIRK